jgi:hypothetical protein
MSYPRPALFLQTDVFENEQKFSTLATNILTDTRNWLLLGS